ncbi:hypothetical protein ABG79_02174 [Caloramator mitchellensis]|uniref:Uncharacterized protein n=1 Tax=Caloramator mitchellensis TaxID=908809 RepID=A0A0R3JST4_CALMK|nr:hypothetical protein [Caloramator mitchellensis]KRQ86042.1 hypothetical protein ABG79_02174 [Caloramator mitchellensis]
MKIGEILKHKQPREYEKLMKERKEHLAFKDIEELMGVHEHIYKRRRGAYRQIR